VPNDEIFTVSPLTKASVGEKHDINNTYTNGFE